VPPAALRLGTPATPANWTYYAGALVAGHDIDSLNGNFTRSEAEAKCAQDTQCMGFTFEALAPSSTSCTVVPCKCYFKSAVNLNTDSAWGTWLKQPMLHPPNPHRTDPACYSATMFAQEAVAVVARHAAAAAASPAMISGAAQQQVPKPLFLYLAMQVGTPAAAAQPSIPHFFEACHWRDATDYRRTCTSRYPLQPPTSRRMRPSSIPRGGHTLAWSAQWTRPWETSRWR
jgi:hypothetical protein